MIVQKDWLTTHADRTLERLLPRIKPLLENAPDTAIFYERLTRQFPRLFRLLLEVYGNQYDFFYHLEQILGTAAQMFAVRPADLKQLDTKREADPLWFHAQNMVGAVCYVDLFAGDLRGMKQKIPYLKELGITYLHLMPLFKAPEKNNDGGYAVSDYRSVNPALGTMAELADLAKALRREGISLVLDMVFNHTSDEHEWALKAQAGDERCQEFYYLFPDRTLPDRYQRMLRDIFPEQAPGSFTWRKDLQKWVWTTFYDFQWDLNYSNPAVFNAMLGEMLFLANQGVEILRLDAVAFIWKQMGTTCESLPQAHLIIQAFNALVKIVAPSLLFKSEAIVHPDDVAAYVSWDESQISYNPTLMALLWESLAARKVTLLQRSMAKRFGLAEKCTWVNYVRVHDDIGWTFANEDAAELWINGFDHRLFLNAFFTGEFQGSFANGVPFNFNPATLDMRISGTAASLAGLEQAIVQNDPLLVDHALKRLLLIHSVIISAGGIPLLYLGDEIATLNDYTYLEDPEKKGDSRWVHRPRFDWERAEQRHDETTIPGRMFQALLKLLEIRTSNPVFAAGTTVFFDTGNPHILGYLVNRSLLVLANFSEAPQTVYAQILGAFAPVHQNGVSVLTRETVKIEDEITLEPLAFDWILYNEVKS